MCTITPVLLVRRPGKAFQICVEERPKDVENFEGLKNGLAVPREAMEIGGGHSWHATFIGQLCG